MQASTNTSSKHIISKRCEKLIQTCDVEYAKEYSAYKALLNPYDPISNPNGIINMGTAVSSLMDDILLERFQVQNDEYFKMSPNNFRYYSFYGSIEFRTNISKFVSKFFKPAKPINYENIFVLNGALVSMDILMSFLLDENEIILVPTPAYNGYFHTGIERWNINICPIPMKHNEKTGEYFELNLDMIETTFQNQLQQGKIIKAFLLNNPHNPTGKIFSKELVLEIMNFCQKNGLHLISDEMYCLSVFNEESTRFHSILELEEFSSLDKDLFHVIWGFSKDLCLTSFRTGIIHTYNEQLKLALILQSQFQAASLPTMNALSKFIIDLDWIENIFVPTHHQRLSAAYIKTKQWLDSMEIPSTITLAGFFLLANFKKFLHPINKESCEALVRHFYHHKIYLTPYWEMKIIEEGWFRIVFTITSEQLDLGLQRLQTAILEWVKK